MVSKTKIFSLRQYLYSTIFSHKISQFCWTLNKNSRLSEQKFKVPTSTFNKTIKRKKYFFPPRIVFYSTRYFSKESEVATFPNEERGQGATDTETANRGANSLSAGWLCSIKISQHTLGNRDARRGFRDARSRQPRAALSSYDWSFQFNLECLRAIITAGVSPERELFDRLTVRRWLAFHVVNSRHDSDISAYPSLD